jgi:hypothetical protein
MKQLAVVGCDRGHDWALYGAANASRQGIAPASDRPAQEKAPVRTPGPSLNLGMDLTTEDPSASAIADYAVRSAKRHSQLVRGDTRACNLGKCGHSSKR